MIKTSLALLAFSLLVGCSGSGDEDLTQADAGDQDGDLDGGLLVDGTSPLGGNVSNVPVELLELHQPLLVEEYGYVPGTGGAG